MRSILLLFSKLNPAVRYVQGMNEVLAPIYYIFSTDADEKNAVTVLYRKAVLLLSFEIVFSLRIILLPFL